MSDTGREARSTKNAIDPFSLLTFCRGSCFRRDDDEPSNGKWQKVERKRGMENEKKGNMALGVLIDGL